MVTKSVPNSGRLVHCSAWFTLNLFQEEEQTDFSVFQIRSCPMSMVSTQQVSRCYLESRYYIAQSKGLNIISLSFDRKEHIMEIPIFNLSASMSISMKQLEDVTFQERFSWILSQELWMQ